jgi:protein ImuA
MIVQPASPAASCAVRAAEWRPGLPMAARGVPYDEIFASSDDAAGAALALALAWDRLRTRHVGRGDDAPAQVSDERAWLWVQDARAIALGGRPFFHGLPRGLRHRLIHVAAGTAQDALFALEEGLRCRDLAFVLGEIAGNPRALDFTASRRLALAAERHGVPLWLVRVAAGRDLSAARMRWQADCAPSSPPRWNAQAPGCPSWRAGLFRARNHPPGTWTLSDDGQTLAAEPPDSRDLAAAAGARSLAAGAAA